ncbi:flagellar basal body P-ring formation chaperone FlgA [Thalassolituus sp.]|uniref:flagellar basal body P-ring formation chaperone FlgA n=1 Tax=Thalassolituus sp. TaxID=2030822 RepID=UPI002A83ED8A|nr:flagellar basal body P-ring formation chaperone FlgA [Thalassolituus sp.]
MGAPLAETAADDTSWRDALSTRILAQWRSLTTDEQDAEVSYPNFSPQYDLPKCTGEPMIDLIRPLQPGRNGIELRCADPYWVQNLALQLHIYRDVAVLQNPIKNGEIIQPEHVSMIRYDTGELGKGFYLTLADVVGSEAKRSLRTGTVISPDMIEAADIIARGQPVTIRLKRPGIRIEMAGTALTDGHLGEHIRVRNDRSQKILSAEVLGADLVQID